MLKLTFNEPNRHLAWNDNGRYSFHKNITSQARFQLNKAMNMRCRSPSRGTTNSHTGNSTSTSLCTTSIILICVSKGRGRGRGPVVPCVVGYPSPSRRCGSLPCGSMCCWLSLPQPPFATARGLAWGGGAYRAERRQLRGAWGGGLRRGHAARYRDIYIYIIPWLRSRFAQVA